MFTTFASSIILSSVLSGVVTADAANRGEVWLVDKTTVCVGGCISITINRPSRLAYEYTMSIDSGPPVRLVDTMGTTLRRGDRTLVLLSHQLFSHDGVQVDTDNPELFHMVPLFHRPGIVRLTLLLGDEKLGTKDITVIDAPEGSDQAIEMLFLTLEPKRRDATAAPLLFQILMGANVSNILKYQDDAIDRLHEELEIVSKHPDWAEIAVMTVAQAEATVHYKSTIEACRVAHAEGRELNSEPPVPPSISLALEREMTSPYAKVIQDGIRKTIGARRWIKSLIGAQGETE